MRVTNLLTNHRTVREYKIITRQRGLLLQLNSEASNVLPANL